MSYDISKITAPTTHDLQKAQNTVNYPLKGLKRRA